MKFYFQSDRQIYINILCWIRHDFSTDLMDNATMCIEVKLT